MTHHETCSVRHEPILSHHRNRSLGPPHALEVTLLLDIRLRTPLLRLSDIMLCLVFLLIVLVPGQPGQGAPCSSLDPVRHASSQIAQLALCLLSFTLPVLVDSFSLQTLSAQQASHGLFGGANRLVPAALGAVWVVLRYTAGARDCEGTDFADAVGEVFLGVTFAARLFAFGLERGVSIVVRKPGWAASNRED